MKARRRHKGSRWTKRRDELLSKLWVTDTPISEIGRQLGINCSSAISQRARRLNLPNKPNALISQSPAARAWRAKVFGAGALAARMANKASREARAGHG